MKLAIIEIENPATKLSTSIILSSCSEKYGKPIKSIWSVLLKCWRKVSTEYPDRLKTDQKSKLFIRQVE